MFGSQQSRIHIQKHSITEHPEIGFGKINSGYRSFKDMDEGRVLSLPPNTKTTTTKRFS